MNSIMFEVQLMSLKIYSGPKIIVVKRKTCQRIILISALIKMVFLSKTVAKPRLIKDKTGELEISSASAFRYNCLMGGPVES